MFYYHYFCKFNIIQSDFKVYIYELYCFIFIRLVYCVISTSIHIINNKGKVKKFL